MGPQSTVPYYLNVVYGVQRKTSPRFFPNVSIESLNVFEILDMIGDERYDELTEHFLEAIGRLKSAGAEIAALTANTAHIVFDRLRERSPLPLVSIVESTVAEAMRRGISCLGLLGTSFTMERDFYRKPFEQAGIRVIVPSEADRRFIDEKISAELEYGIVRPDTRRRFVEIVGRLVAEAGIEAVVLGCTELPLVLDGSTSPVACLDTVKIHSHDLVEAILS